MLADNDGAVVVAATEAEEVLRAARKREADEQEKRKKIQAGVSTVELFNLQPLLDSFKG